MKLVKQELVKWTRSGGATANSGAQGAVAQASQQVIADSAAVWSIAGDPAFPDKGCNAYWYQKFGAQNLASRFEYGISVWVPGSAKPQALELEIQQQIDGIIFNFAAQADYSSGKWRTFNFGLAGGGSWSDFGAVFVPKPDAWLNIGLLGQRGNDMRGVRTLLIDGVIVASVELPSFREPDANLPKYPDQLSIGWQLDFMPAKGAYSVVTKDMSLEWS